MNSKYSFLFIPFLLVAFQNSANSQSIKDEDIEYQYIQLPQTDIRGQVKNYHFTLVPIYEEKNKKLIAEFETEKQKAQQEYDDKKASMAKDQLELDAQYDKEMEQYAVDVKEAEAKYEKEMEEYNKKSMGSKIIEKQVLGQNNKPTKHLPQKPYRKTVSEPNIRIVTMPRIQTTYDFPALCNTYLKLYGFQDNQDNAMQITINLFGFDNTNPTLLTTQQTETRVSNGSTSSYQASYYSTEFSYRHPMSIQIKMPDGKEVLNVTPSEYNNYTVFKSLASKVYQNTGNDMLIKTAEEKVLQANLNKINDMVNNMYGYRPIPRKCTLYYVKNKDQKYTDLLDAFNDASMGLKLIAQDEAMANVKLDKALKIWKAAFAETDLSSKDARIDKDVAIALGFNLLEVYFATKNVTDAFVTLDAMNKMELSKKEKKRKEEYEMLFLELKKRK